MTIKLFYAACKFANHWQVVKYEQVEALTKEGKINRRYDCTLVAGYNPMTRKAAGEAASLLNKIQQRQNSKQKGGNVSPSLD